MRNPLDADIGGKRGDRCGMREQTFSTCYTGALSFDAVAIGGCDHVSEYV